MAWTKEERAEYMKRYRQENREQINANKRYYYKRNRERILQNERRRESARSYYERHKNDPEYKARQSESKKRWDKKNREHLNAYMRARYRAMKGAKCESSIDKYSTEMV